jgi:hypothetical protein
VARAVLLKWCIQKLSSTSARFGPPLLPPLGHHCCSSFWMPGHTYQVRDRQRAPARDTSSESACFRSRSRQSWLHRVRGACRAFCRMPLIE